MELEFGFTLEELLEQVKKREIRGYDPFSQELKTKISIVEDILDYKTQHPSDFDAEKILSTIKEKYDLVISHEEIGKDGWGSNISDATIRSLIQRINEVEDPTLDSVFEREIEEEKNYDIKYHEIKNQLEEKYNQKFLDFVAENFSEDLDKLRDSLEKNGVDMASPENIQSLFKNALSLIYEVMQKQKKRELNKAYFENHSFISKKYEIDGVHKKLCMEHVKKNLKALTGYTSNYSYFGDQERKEILEKLRKNNGRTTWMRIKDKTIERIDNDLVYTLKIISKFDYDKDCRSIATEMVQTYEKTGQLR